ncbi:hypothetical protein BV25DRAFT_1961843 [Artomyces pyxidatus]|uniref:Uncharacterized protein n=1 Tax=Artomyces pyxidatus TaxID=48021 RepID=A0ACB8SS60_9AGAM|nr:hypothetical protein BV25DRAFT_1961843 [Artomyces pyxidatus]
MEGISRTMRSYVPSSISIAIPSASPSPPRVSLPVSFGSFMTPSSSTPSRGTDRRRSWGTDAGKKTLDEVLALDGQRESDTRPSLARYPGSDEGERITWAKWANVSAAAQRRERRLLFLGYISGLQIWDCTNLDSIVELLNLPNPDWGRIWSADVLPTPSSSDDQFARARPLVGAIAKRSGQHPDFIVYSLATHRVVKKLSVVGLVSSSANSNFIIISTSNPTTLRILSACTLATLSIIPSLSLSAFVRQANTNVTNDTNPVLFNNAIDTEEPPSAQQPQPVFALSHRLLAYASPPPRTDLSSTTPTATEPRARSPTRAATTEGEIGSMALRVGGSVLSGMRSLGELAFTAARSRMSTEAQSPTTARPQSSGQARFFSRSAPTASHPEERPSASLGDEIVSVPSSSPTSPYPSTPSTRGHYVTVVDLMPLLSSKSKEPGDIAEFVASKRQPISSLCFSADGTSVMVVPEDGQTLKVFQIRPESRALRTAKELEKLGDGDQRAPWHMYDLRRGRTSAVVEGQDWTSDSRWVAIGTKNRTVHVFATNPYGGKPEEQSHMKGRVFNCTELQPLSTSVTPIVRLRATQAPPADRNPAPLAFTFISSDSHSLPKRLLPAPGEPLSPTRLRRPTNFQDILLFDPMDGSVSLRRFIVELRPYETNLSVPSSVPGLGGTSISLPTRPSFGRPSASPPKATAAQRASGLSQMLVKPAELVGRESEVATWNLRRGNDWPMVTRTIAEVPPETCDASVGKTTWLSHAELQTNSHSPHILPRTIYLSHQFSFREFSGDYHGLLRRYQLDVPGPEIEVRKVVEVSAYSAGVGESFVQGSVGSHDVSRTSSSFDEPLSSAMASGLEYPSSPPVIPMFPNGTPGSKPSSYKNSIPIQRMTAGFSDGMSEGIGRLRREISKVRSPRLIARPDHPTSGDLAELEFDEEDEDFLLSYGPDPLSPEGEGDTISRSTSRDEGGSAASISTPSTGADLLEHQSKDDSAWDAWDTEDRQAVEDAEQFHEISVVGFMDEEQAQMKKRKSRGRALGH